MMNPMLALFSLGGGEIVVVLAVVLLMFGGKKIPQLARGLGQSVKEFKKATSENSDQIDKH
jgi:sec-independent protein translocase protein TatA